MPDERTPVGYRELAAEVLPDLGRRLSAAPRDHERRDLLIQAGAMDRRAREIKRQREALRDELRQVCQKRDALLQRAGVDPSRLDTQNPRRAHSGNHHPAQAQQAAGT